METIKINNYIGKVTIDEINQYATFQANKIISEMKKSWLARQLGISNPTLHKRLSDNQWKPKQVKKIQEIYEFLF